MECGAISRCISNGLTPMVDQITFGQSRDYSLIGILEPKSVGMPHPPRGNFSSFFDHFPNSIWSLAGVIVNVINHLTQIVSGQNS